MHRVPRHRNNIHAPPLHLSPPLRGEDRELEHGRPHDRRVPRLPREDNNRTTYALSSHLPPTPFNKPLHSGDPHRRRRAPPPHATLPDDNHRPTTQHRPPTHLPTHDLPFQTLHPMPLPHALRPHLPPLPPRHPHHLRPHPAHPPHPNPHPPPKLQALQRNLDPLSPPLRLRHPRPIPLEIPVRPEPRHHAGGRLHPCARAVQAPGFHGDESRPGGRAGRVRRGRGGGGDAV